MPRRPLVNDIHTFRSDMDHMPGQLAAQRRLANFHGRIYAAFESLELMPVDAVLDYIEGPLRRVVPEPDYGKVAGIFLALGITLVEAERQRVREEREGIILKS